MRQPILLVTPRMLVSVSPQDRVPAPAHAARHAGLRRAREPAAACKTDDGQRANHAHATLPATAAGRAGLRARPRRRGARDLRLEREGQLDHDHRRRQARGDQGTIDGRQPAARHRRSPGRQAALHLRLGRRHVQILDTASHEIVGTLPSGPDPELMVLSPDGKHALRRQRGRQHRHRDRHRRAAQVLAEIPVGVEPEGMGGQPRRQVAWSTPPRPPTWRISSTPTTHEITDNVLVDQRPRFAEFTADDAEVWVSPEIGGTVSVIDNATPQGQAQDHLRDPGRAARGDPAGRHPGHQGPQQGLRGARAGQPGGGGRRADLRGRELPAGRPAGLAARVQPGREVPLHAPTASPTTSR